MMGDRLVCQHTKKALLSISDGRASSFFNTSKDYNTATFFTGSGFLVQRYEEKRRKSEKFRENQRKSEKFRENQRKSEKIRENRINSDKNRRKSEKNEELYVNFWNICKNYL